MPARSDNQTSLGAARSLADVLDRGADEQDPALLALLMAAEFFSGLSVQEYLRRIDALAVRARDRLGRARTPARVISAINAVLFEEEGLAGNVEDYYDPRNSFLNEVLDLRAGIPITLSVVWLAVARRLRQPVAGVGLPMHFIVKYISPRAEIFVDPFSGGQILTREECVARIGEALGGATPETAERLLMPVPPRDILYRMLTNLKFIYLKRKDFANAAKTVDMMLQVRPDEPEEIRDRGLLHFQMEEWARAARLLQRYLVENPAADDFDAIGIRLRQAANHRARLN
jgi:regulator of sirC expression with transglutaminase-like and TPR domain